MQKKCTSCGKFVDSSINFCPYCGRLIKSQTSDEMAGCGLLLFGMIFAVIMLYMNTKGSIVEFFNDIPYQQNIWCGTYNKNTKGVRILEQDIEKGGSTICMAADSWKDSRKIKLTETKKQSFDIYDDKIIIIEATISNDKFVNVKNVKEWQNNENNSIKNPIKINTKRNGIFKLSRSDGSLLEERTYKNDKIESSKFYYDDGTLAEERIYKDDKIDGIAQKFYGDGSHCKALWRNNKLISENCYKKDGNEIVLNGAIKFYHKNGKLASECNYENKKREGICKSYYTNGVLEAEQSFKNNELNGERKFYNMAGALITTTKYKNGKLIK